MVLFRRSRKKNHVSSLFARAKRAQTSVFNQKTMFLGYAHSSNTESNARFARVKWLCCSFFGQSPKNEQPFLFFTRVKEDKSSFLFYASEARATKPLQLFKS
ncbi:MAG: hypothetical protein U5L45_01425 [Saprospiraceae bacterium]|nr:hypothetical protein [Saprospiraceae bacterium]